MLSPEFGNLRLYLWPTPGPKFRTVDSRRGHCSQRVDAIVNRYRNQPLIERDPGNALDGCKNCSLLTARIDHRAHELARNDDGQFSLSDAGRVAFRRKSLEVPQATLENVKRVQYPNHRAGRQRDLDRTRLNSSRVETDDSTQVIDLLHTATWNHLGHFRCL
jgi:hypothetical protein